MMIEALHSGGVVTKPAMCSCLELCVLPLPCTQCRVLGVAGIGIVELTIHSVSCDWCGLWSHAGIRLQGNANIDKIGDRQDRLNLSTTPSHDILHLGDGTCYVPFEACCTT